MSAAALALLTLSGAAQPVMGLDLRCAPGAAPVAVKRSTAIRVRRSGQPRQASACLGAVWRRWARWAPFIPHRGSNRAHHGQTAKTMPLHHLADASRRIGHQTHLLCHPASLTSPTLRSAPRVVSFGWASGLTTRWAAQRVRNRRTCVKKWQAHLENSLPVQTRPHMPTWRRSRSARPLSISKMGHPVLILPHFTCAAAPSL